MSVAIIDYGAGNIFSIEQAFERIGVETILTSDFNVIKKASHVIFPGVGHAKSAMEQLKQTGLDKLIPTLTQPVLGICLGMQLLCNFSEEGAVNGLGIFDTTIRVFSYQKIVPQMGWNDVEFLVNSNMTNQSFFEGDYSGAYYFVHSYRADNCDNSWAKTKYEDDIFASALKKDNFYGVQFHPEKSGKLGTQFLLEFTKI